MAAGHARRLLRGGAPQSLASQAANSGGNLLLAVVVARQVSPSEFGAWSLGYAAYMMALAVTRALACTPLLLVRPESSNALRRSAGGALAMALLLGAGAGLLVAVIGLVRPDLAAVLLPFAVCLPVLMGQDVLRHYGFSDSDSGMAAGLDVSWLVLQILAFVIIEWYGIGSTALVTVVWALAALPAVLWIIVRRNVIPGRRSLVAFWRATRADGIKLLADSALASTVTQALPVVVAVAAGLAAAGALRGGLTLMGCINILVAGLTPIATVAAQREFDRVGSTAAFVRRWSMLVAVVSLVNGVVLLSLPDSVGRELLGGTWQSASSLVLALTVHSMLRGPFTGVPIALRASDRVGEALRLRIWITAPSLVLPWGGALAFGLTGAVWGIVASALVANVISLGVSHRWSGPATLRSSESA